MRSEYLIGCDLGTSSTKVELVTISGKTINFNQIYYNILSHEEGRAEQKSNVYVNALSICIKKILNDSCINPDQILAFGLSSHSPTFLPVDKSLNPLGNVILYSDDRSVNECEWLVKNIGKDRILKLSGNAVKPSYSFTKALWFKKNHNELFLKTYKFLNIKDYIIYLLTGEIATDYSTAALNGIVFDIKRKKWDKDILSDIGIDHNKLPSVAPGDRIIGFVNNKGSNLFGLRKKTPIILGTLDACASFLATGVINNNECALQMGSAASLGIIFESSNFSKHLENCPYIVNTEKKYLSMGSIFCGGMLLSWLKNLLYKNDDSKDKAKIYEIIEKETSNTPLGSDGLIMFPFLMREGAPYWDKYSKGGLFGLSLKHSRGNLLRAAMESVGFGINKTIDILKNSKIGIKPPIFLVGGGFKNKLWRRIITNIFGIQCAYFSSMHDASFASAFLAGKAIGIFKDYSEIKRWIGKPEKVEVDNIEFEKYQRLYKFWVELYNFLKIKYKELDELIS